ncbi:ion channel [Desulfovibrio sp. MES5]|uniref:ion channel n=1 Tax=Desulfovibrio sp. MES5 TaxID=1899016 RepID=UPI0025B9505F|nr:ion channel [Desulfovibrio sp. MES5]
MTSLLCVFVFNIFFPDNIYGGMAQSIYLPFQLLAGLVLFEFKRRIIWLVVLFGVLLMICRSLNLFFASSLLAEVLLLYICFFGSVTLEVFRQIARAQMVSTRMIYAAICGLMLIAYCGFYLFLAIEFANPGSFNGLGEGENAINNLFYFSYITILTIGYGDITPHTWIAKNAVVLVGFIAYVYSIVVIATIVGRVQRVPHPSPAGQATGIPAATPHPAPHPAAHPASSHQATQASPLADSLTSPLPDAQAKSLAEPQTGQQAPQAAQHSSKDSDPVRDQA